MGKSWVYKSVQILCEINKNILMSEYALICNYTTKFQEKKSYLKGFPLEKF